MTTIRVDFDQDSWLYVPETWPWNGFTDLDHWVTTVTDLITEAYGFDAATRQWLSDSLRAIEAGQPEIESRFIYLAHPDKFIFFVSVIYKRADDAFTLEQLAAVDDPAVTRSPDAEPIVSPHLGEGIRSVRYVDVGEPDHDIAAIAQYAWRCGGLDIIAIAANFNIVLLDDLLPTLDALAQSISVVDG